MSSTQIPITDVTARAYEVPTDAPESDGTLSWDKTTLVLVTIAAGGSTGIGFTYSHSSLVPLIADKFASELRGANCLDIAALYWKLQHNARNLERQGLVMMAISAIDVALWDLKGKLLGMPLASLLGRARDQVEIYGSGGFTSYSDARLQEQLSRWVHVDGCRSVKMKVGREPGSDLHRVRVAKDAIGDATLYVDGNGAYGRKQALSSARAFAEFGVGWFEEPVSSDDLEGLRLIRDRAPAGMDIAAGEYGSTLVYFERMLDAGAVDVQQADITRCGGVTGFLAAGVLCQAHQIDLSGHTAPSLHLHPACAAMGFRNLEWFHDHVRIEHMLFDGAPVPEKGFIRPDLSRPGLGLEFKARDAERFAV